MIHRHRKHLRTFLTTKYRLLKEYSDLHTPSSKSFRFSKSSGTSMLLPSFSVSLPSAPMRDQSMSRHTLYGSSGMLQYGLKVTRPNAIVKSIFRKSRGKRAHFRLKHKSAANTQSFVCLSVARKVCVGTPAHQGEIRATLLRPRRRVLKSEQRIFDLAKWIVRFGHVGSREVKLAHQLHPIEQTTSQSRRLHNSLAFELFPHLLGPQLHQSSKRIERGQALVIERLYIWTCCHFSRLIPAAETTLVSISRMFGSRPSLKSRSSQKYCDNK